MFNKSISGLTLLITALTLGACGGSNSKVDPNVDPVVDPVIEPQVFDVSGSVTGLNGSVQLNWLSTNKELIEDGNFEFPATVEEGENVELSLSNIPVEQDCAITSDTAFNAVAADISNVVITCSNKTVLKVTLSNYFTGDSLADVNVTAGWTAEYGVTTQTAQTDDNGEAIIYVSPMEGRVTLSASGQGFSAQSRSIDLTAESVEVESELRLQPINAVVNFSAATGGDLDVENVDVVTVAANAFVDADGNVYSGEIASEITIIDPTRDPALMPGGYQTRSTDSGEVAQIESFGAINVEFFDAAGNELNLGEGQTATIRIPVAAVNSTPPATIPLYFFDEATGFWVEDGEAVLVEREGVWVYEGTVSHFTVWNADRIYETVYIQGCVEDANGAAVVGAAVSTRGFDYIGTASAVSNEQGLFSVPVKINSTAFLTAINGVQSRTLTIDVGDADIAQADCLVVDVASSTITLSWGEDPVDLDSHFFGVADDALIDDFHVYYSQKDAVMGDSYIYLDVDDISSFGPEVVSISSFTVPGTYRYAVHHYSGLSDIAASPARVELNLNGVETIYAPPAGEPSLCWAVFDIVVASNGAISVNTISTWESEVYCKGVSEGDDSIDDDFDSLQTAQKTSVPGGKLSKPGSVLQQSISTKYYAN